MKFFQCRNCHYEFTEMPLSRYRLEHKIDPEDHKRVFRGLDKGVKAPCPNCHTGVLEKNVTHNYVLKADPHLPGKKALEKKYGIVDSNKPDHLASLKVIKPKKEVA